MNSQRRRLLLGCSAAAVGPWLLTGCSAPPAETVSLGYNGVLSMRISPDGSRVLVGSVAQGAGLWQWRTRQRLATLNHAGDERAQVFTSAFSPDGNHAVTAERRNLIHWNLGSGQPLGHWSAAASVRNVALAQQGRRILAALDSREAWLLDGRNVRLPLLIPHADAVRSVDISADGAWGVSGADDGMLRLWDLERGSAVLREQFQAPVTVCCFSSDLRWLFAGPAYGSGKLWQLSDLALRHAALGAVRGGFSRARYSADGTRLLTATAAGQISLWAVESGALLQQWQLPHTWLERSEARLGVLDLGFDAAARQVLAAVSNGSVLAWPLG